MLTKDSTIYNLINICNNNYNTYFNLIKEQRSFQSHKNKWDYKLKQNLFACSELISKNEYVFSEYHENKQNEITHFLGLSNYIILDTMGEDFYTNFEPRKHTITAEGQEYLDKVIHIINSAIQNDAMNPELAFKNRDFFINSLKNIKNNTVFNAIKMLKVILNLMGNKKSIILKELKNKENIIDAIKLRKDLDDLQTTHILLLSKPQTAWLKDIPTIFGYRTDAVTQDFLNAIQFWIKNKDDEYLPHMPVDTEMLFNTEIQTELKPEEFYSSGSAMQTKILIGKKKERVSKTMWMILNNINPYDEIEKILNYPKNHIYKASAIKKSENMKQRPFINCDNDIYIMMTTLYSMLIPKLSSTVLYAYFTKDQKIDFLKNIQQKCRDKKHWFFPLDQSRFDQHMSTRVLLKLLDHLALRFKNVFFQKIIEGIKNMITHTHLNIKGLQLNENIQQEYKVQGGLLSGWKLTSFFGSVVNALTTQYLMKKMRVEKYDMVTMGDDLYLCVDKKYISDPNLFLNDYIDLASNEGIVIKRNQSFYSDHYCEWLRMGIDEFGINTQPFRLISSIIAQKPWSSLGDIEDLGAREVTMSWTKLNQRLGLKINSIEICRHMSKNYDHIHLKRDILKCIETYPLTLYHNKIYYKKEQIKHLFNMFNEGNYSFINGMVDKITEACLGIRSLTLTDLKQDLCSLTANTFSVERTVSYYKPIKSIEIQQMKHLIELFNDGYLHRYALIIENNDEQFRPFSSGNFIMDKYIHRLRINNLDKLQILANISKRGIPMNHHTNNAWFKFFTGEEKLPSIYIPCFDLQASKINKIIDAFIIFNFPYDCRLELINKSIAVIKLFKLLISSSFSKNRQLLI